MAAPAAVAMAAAAAVEVSVCELVLTAASAPAAVETTLWLAPLGNHRSLANAAVSAAVLGNFGPASDSVGPGLQSMAPVRSVVAGCKPPWPPPLPCR